MWLKEDVVARRADRLTDAERVVISKCNRTPLRPRIDR